ncbi:MAG: putative porin [Xanthomonadales bacterium]|nr:putative porin [Xanthomonadales bacterium]
MKKIAMLLGVSAAFLSSTLPAAASDEELQALRAQIQRLTQRLDALESKNEQAESPPAGSGSDLPTVVAGEVNETIEAAVEEQITKRMAAAAWTERMRWQGDFRYRYENIDDEGRDDRNRNRIRARVNLGADLSPTLSIGLGLASGGTDPVSSNQTLGGGGSSKDIRLDLAYFDWSGLENTHILGGKMKNHLAIPGSSQLLWDSDWRPEGLGAGWDNGRFFAKGLGTWLEGDSARGTEFAWVAQAGVIMQLPAEASLRLGAGYAQFDLAGQRPIFGAADNFQGNSFDPATLTYLHDYHEIEAFTELDFRLGGKPAKFFADYVYNTEADDNNEGYLVGFTYGAARGMGNWQLSYTYQRLEKDAVVGILSNSDFGGGGTDVRGSVFSGAYALQDKWHFNVSYYLNEVGLAAGKPRDSNRLQVDMKFKYD